MKIQMLFTILILVIAFHVNGGESSIPFRPTIQGVGISAVAYTDGPAHSIAIDPVGNIYTCESNSVAKMDELGNPIARWAVRGTSLAIHPNGSAYFIAQDHTNTLGIISRANLLGLQPFTSDLTNDWELLTITSSAEIYLGRPLSQGGNYSFLFGTLNSDSSVRPGQYFEKPVVAISTEYRDRAVVAFTNGFLRYEGSRPWFNFGGGIQWLIKGPSPYNFTFRTDGGLYAMNSTNFTVNAIAQATEPNLLGCINYDSKHQRILVASIAPPYNVYSIKSRAHSGDGPLSATIAVRQIGITWECDPHQQYVVEFKESGQSGKWNRLSGPHWLDEPGSKTITDTVTSTNQMRLYRVNYYPSVEE